MIRFNERYDYPENLLRALEIDDNIIKDILSDRERLASIEYALAIGLSERDYTIARLYYKDKLSCAEIAKLENIGYSRVTDIIRHVKRRIAKGVDNRPYQIICEGVQGYFMRLRKDALEAQKMLYANEDITNDNINVSIDTTGLSNTIDTLDLSVRSYNCLARADKRYIWQLYILNENDLMHMRNLGAKSREEIEWKLVRLYGFDFCCNDEESYRKRLEVTKSLGYIDDETVTTLINKMHYYKTETKIVKRHPIRPIERLSGGDFDGSLLDGDPIHDPFRGLFF